MYYMQTFMFPLSHMYRKTNMTYTKNQQLFGLIAAALHRLVGVTHTHRPTNLELELQSWAIRQWL